MPALTADAIMNRLGTAARATALACALVPQNFAVAQELHQEHGASGHHHPAAALTDSDRAAAFPDVGGIEARHAMHDDPLFAFARFDRLEMQDGRDEDRLHWDFKASIGRDFSRLWIRSEGERVSGGRDHARVELLYGRAAAPWWDLLAGVRHDLRPGSSRSWAGFGVQGVAPYRFEITATAWVGEGGRVAAEIESEYEMLLTQRLVLQPLFKLSWYAEADEDRGIGAGLYATETGFRLRYELRREVAPYVGLLKKAHHSGTADLLRRQGRPARDSRIVLGVRMWF